MKKPQPNPRSLKARLPPQSARKQRNTKHNTAIRKLDFDTDNKFVDAVVAKYGIDREGLITAYSVKGRDSNYVWQFNGSRDENGKLIRNADTLKYVYYVNADCSKVSRTGGYTGNDGCTLKDGLTVFLLTQKVLIPNLQEQIDQNS